MKKILTIAAILLVVMTATMIHHGSSSINEDEIRNYIESGRWVETTSGEEGGCIYFFDEEEQHMITLWTPSYESDLVTIVVKGYNETGDWAELTKIEADKGDYEIALLELIGDCLTGVL